MLLAEYLWHYFFSYRYDTILSLLSKAQVLLNTTMTVRCISFWLLSLFGLLSGKGGFKNNRFTLTSILKTTSIDLTI